MPWSGAGALPSKGRRHRPSGGSERNPRPGHPAVAGLGDNAAPDRTSPGIAMTDLAVVVPVFNERDNTPPLLAEIASALRGRIDFEIIYVDDDSTDDSVAVLTAAKAQYPELRVIRHV